MQPGIALEKQRAAERVKRPHENGAAALAGGANHAILHLARGPVCEGQRENGFAGARARDDQQRSFVVTHGGALSGIEFVSKFRRRCSQLEKIPHAAILADLCPVRTSPWSQN